MRNIPSVPPPKKYGQLLAAKAGFSELSSEPAIRQALWDQQGGICAYCERKLLRPALPNHRTRIEHFHPQGGLAWTADCKLCSGARSDGDAPTTWTNLLLCCDGNEYVGKPYTCDKLKGNKDICVSFRNPKLWPGGNLVIIERNGCAKAIPGLPPGADDVVRQVLNLNTPQLRDVRISILAARRKAYLKRRIRKQGMTKAERAGYAQKIRNEAVSAEYPSTLLSFAESIT